MSIRAALNSVPLVNPFVGFNFVDLDEGPPMYVGKLAANGAWIIQKFTGTEMRFCGGAPGGYSEAWTNRATQTYLMPNETE